jgi:hypothetical protein
MRIINHIKKHNRGGLIGGMIYLGLGIITLTSYFMEKKGIKMKIMKQEKTIDNQSCQPNEAQHKMNIPQN